MTSEPPSRHITFDEIFNFRDLGGYRTREGRAVTWRRLFRSDELQGMTDGDAACLREDIGLVSVVDLRSEEELAVFGIGPVDGLAPRYYSIPFVTGMSIQESKELY